MINLISKLKTAIMILVNTKFKISQFLAKDRRGIIILRSNICNCSTRCIDFVIISNAFSIKVHVVEQNRSRSLNDDNYCHKPYWRIAANNY